MEPLRPSYPLPGVILGILLLLPGLARGTVWEIVPGHDDTQLIFHSKATLESFDGKTNQVTGWIDFDASAVMDSISWQVDVDLASLDTGVGLRNTHMRENHLHTKQYPKAIFQGGSLKGAPTGPLVENAEITLTLVGEFSLHGVTRTREIPVRARLRSDGALQVDTEFSVSLAEHEIPLPKFLMMKLADVQQVKLRFRAVPRPGENP